MLIKKLKIYLVELDQIKNYKPLVRDKTRKLEFLVGDAIEKGSDTLVTQGAVQSNHARQTAAAAAKFGLKCHILLERRVTETEKTYEITPSKNNMAAWQVHVLGPKHQKYKSKLQTNY